MDERALGSALALLNEETSDTALQEALLSAGLEALTPAEQPGILALWEPSGTGYVYRALLIDAPEPLWRYREEPVKESLSTDTGPMERWVMRPNLYLELAESGTSAVQRFVRSPGGTRTLLMLNPGATSLHLVLRQHELGLEGGGTTDFTVLNSDLSPDPVWVMNEIEE